MAFYEQFPVHQVILTSWTNDSYPSPSIVAGNQTTRAAVLAEVDPKLAIGSLYLSTQGKGYIKVANAGVLADWQVITTTAAD